MNEQEQKDLDILKQETQTIKVNCYEMLRYLNRYDARELETSGYKGKNNAEAMQIAFNSYQKRIEKLLTDYIRKYPDDK